MSSAVLADFHHGLVLDADECIGCVRFRLDRTSSTQPIVRAVCDSVMPDSGASSCAISEATFGQHAVADPVNEGAKACDSMRRKRFLDLELEVTCAQRLYPRPLQATA